MSPNPDFANQLVIDFAPSPEGSCVSDALLAEIARRMRITIPQNAVESSVPCISKQSNNLATLDAQKCLFVAAGNVFRDQKDWLVATPAAIEFSGWPSTMDPTSDPFFFIPLFDPADYGAGRVNLVSFSATSAIFSVTGAAHNVTIILFIVQSAVAPEPS